MRHHSLLATTLALAALASAPALACNPVGSLPAVLDAPGRYCLAASLASGQTTGAAITLASDDVELDCGGHTLDGSAAGPGTLAVGILGGQHDNLRVRECTVNGFATGIALGDDAAAGDAPQGVRVEQNRVVGSLHTGILVNAGSGLVRGNFLLDGGLGPDARPLFAVQASGNVDLIDNVVDGLSHADDQQGPVTGIALSHSQGGVIAGNRVRNLFSRLERTGIAVRGAGVIIVRRNLVSHHFPTEGSLDLGLDCQGGLGLVADNHALQVGQAQRECQDLGGNTWALAKSAPRVNTKPGVAR